MQEKYPEKSTRLVCLVGQQCVTNKQSAHYSSPDTLNAMGHDVERCLIKPNIYTRGVVQTFVTQFAQLSANECEPEVVSREIRRDLCYCVCFCS